ncbi:MAG: hypothetical protein KF764_01990 [Labilithrix sp.]|nr:hypothetical protein [Labilithrix sp.]MBX3219443.1 hypothetical protein [Labilithrix sp.]
MTQAFGMGGRTRDIEPSSRRGADPRAASDAIAGAGEGSARRLHARAPAVLERELRRLAETLRVPLSNLVRALVEDAVAVADHASEGLEVRLRRLATSLGHERGKLRRRVMPDPLDGVVAFQPVKLAQAASCAKCTTELRRGQSASLGLRDEARPSGVRVFVCGACVPAD